MICFAYVGRKRIWVSIINVVLYCIVSWVDDVRGEMCDKMCDMNEQGRGSVEVGGYVEVKVI